jgi:hypothetical protein
MEEEQERQSATSVAFAVLWQGRLHAWRARWFGERDAVADQLADIARQGSEMARLAHVRPP